MNLKHKIGCANEETAISMNRLDENEKRGEKNNLW